MPIKSSQKNSAIIICLTDGQADIIDAINWPKGLDIYLADYDCEGSDNDLVNVSNIGGGRCALHKYMDNTPELDAFKGEIVAQAIEMWGRNND
ncbi:MAG: hypothetical protein U5K75_02990 [Ahrensia sp.]|nr:hypothetical protein [Ahrensia sp.]